MTALVRWLSAALLNLFGGIDAPYSCPECGEHKRGPARLRTHLALDHPDWEART